MREYEFNNKKQTLQLSKDGDLFSPRDKLHVVGALPSRAFIASFVATKISLTATNNVIQWDLIPWSTLKTTLT